MAFRRRLANFADVYLRHYLQLKEQEEQSRLIGDRQRELADFQNKFRVGQAEDARNLELLKQGLGDQSGQQFEALNRAGMAEIAGLPLSGLRHTPEMGFSKLAERIGSAKDRSAIPSQLQIEAEGGGIAGLNPKDPRWIERGIGLARDKSSAFDMSDAADIAKAGETAEVQAYGQGIGSERATAESFPANLKRDVTKFKTMTPLEVGRASQVASVQQSAQTAGEGARIKQAQELAAADPMNANLAQQVIKDPTLLDKIDARQRKFVIDALGSQRFQGVASKQSEAMINTAEDAIDKMLNHPGFSAAVGFKGPVGMFFEEGFSGTSRADFEALAKQFEAAVALPNLRYMQGLGHMSDREFQTVVQASSAITRARTEAEYRAELLKMKDAFERTRQEKGFAPKPGQSQGPNLQSDPLSSAIDLLNRRQGAR